MGAYILRRILLMIPTLFGIMAISFAVIQFAPGGPVEQVIAKLTGQAGGDRADRRRWRRRHSAAGQSGAAGEASSKYRGAQGLDPEFIAKLEKQFGFDKPPLERFGLMLWNYVRFDFGDSYFRDISVIDLILEKMPVSISLGLWITLLSYLISIPLGIRKAVKDGSAFDVWTSGVVIVGYAIPGFLFAILLMVLFAGGSFFDWFPLRGLTSDNWDQLSLVAEDPRLSLASGPAADGDGAVGLRHHDAAHQELVPRRDPQAICRHGARQGPVRAAGALRPRLPQRDADRDRRLSRRLHLGLLHRLAADREHLLARRARPARLPLGARPRLSRGLRHPLHLLAARPGRRPDLRPHLHLDRSAHRFRAEGR